MKWNLTVKEKRNAKLFGALVFGLYVLLLGNYFGAF